jgi:hypothetical protein
MSPRAKSKAVVDTARLNGPEKAAIVLLALGEDHTGIWSALDEEEIKEVSQAMATLGTVSASVVEELLVEFVAGMSSSGAIMGSFEQTQRLLGAFMPSEKVDSLMEEIRGPAGRTMWDKLGNVNEDGARQLSEERIPADGRCGAVEDQGRARLARAGRPARGLRPRVCPAHAADGAGAARDPRQDRDRRCAPSSCPTWRARPSATATR